MEKIIKILLFLLPNLLIGQIPDSNSNSGLEFSMAKASYAVVVGFSDYQHPSIPDLKFAHKDAEEFSQFLQTKGGGNLPASHIKLLLNEQATNAQIIAAMDWLLDVVDENENAIIYFSGHSDIETLTRSQLGFLLTWDSPPQTYMAGAFPLFYLKEVIQTLSIDKRAKVIMVSDACRSGNLAGAQISGAQLTSANLAQQFAQEVKILSCQPNEFSIEGEQWGGGRGLFSFFLTNGLYGKADHNEDGAVNLMEIGRYLEDNVTVEAAPHTQLPMTVGNRLEKLAFVSEDFLAALNPSEEPIVAYATSTDKGNLEQQTLENADANTKVIYQRFEKAIQEQNFLYPVDESANVYYEQLKAIPEFTPLFSTIRRTFSAAMQDEVQQALNALIEADPHEVNRFFFNPEHYARYPEYLQKSIDLAEKDHYSIPSLQAKKKFFEAVVKHRILSESDKIDKSVRDSLHLVSQQLIDEAIALEPLGAYLYYGKGLFYTFYVPSEIDSVIHYNLKAVELSPKWILPYLTIASEYMYNLRDYPNAEKWLLKAHQINPESYVVMERLCWIYQMLDRTAEAKVLAQKMLEINPDLFNSAANMGGVNLSLLNYSEAEKWYKKSLEIEDYPASFAHLFLGQIYFQTRRIEKGKSYYHRCIADPGTPYWMKGRYYAFYGAFLVNLSTEYDEAEKYLAESRKLLNLPIEQAESYVLCAKSSVLQEEWEEAEERLEKAFALDTLSGPIILAHALKGSILSQRGQIEEAELYFKKSIMLTSGVYIYDMHFRKEALYRYGVFLLSQNRLEEAKAMFEQCVEYIHERGFFGYLGLALLAAEEKNNELTFACLEKSLDNWLPLKELQLKEFSFSDIQSTERYETLLKKHSPDYKK